MRGDEMLGPLELLGEWVVAEIGGEAEVVKKVDVEVGGEVDAIDFNEIGFRIWFPDGVD